MIFFFFLGVKDVDTFTTLCSLQLISYTQRRVLIIDIPFLLPLKKRNKCVVGNLSFRFRDTIKQNQKNNNRVSINILFYTTFTMTC